MIQEERADEVVDTAWDGKLQRIKSIWNNVVNDQNKILKELESHFDSSFRTKIEQKTQELQYTSDRHFSSLSLRAEYIDNMITKCMKEVSPIEASQNQAIAQ